MTEQGKLFLIGGAADQVLASLVEESGGKTAHILLFPQASAEPEESGQSVSSALMAFSPAKVSIAVDERTIAPDVTAIFMLGGDQTRLIEWLGPAGHSEVRRFFARGGLVAGTSAGAAATAEIMIAGGMPDGKIRPGALAVAPGLGLTPAIVDTHFGERGRFNRLIAALRLMPERTGIGLDEDTAVILAGGKASVRGRGHATFFQAGDAHPFTRVAVLSPGETLDLPQAG